MSFRPFLRMAESTGKILEGVLAINKPPNLSSAQVIRDLQNHFTDSRIFEPLVQQTLALKDAARRDPKRRRKSSGSQNLVKMGHGGTLDPMATGVLIIGIGAGTKRLSDFLLCSKTYDTTVLFGKSSDTYDIAGRNVAEAPHEHITRKVVEQNLAQFRGTIKQVPPIYSALKIDGMKAYEYARSGKELPRELQSREMVVTKCELVEFHKGGTHNFRWPADDAGEEDKKLARKLLGQTIPTTENETVALDTESTPEIRTQPNLDDAAPNTTPPPSRKYDNSLSPTAKAALHTHTIPELSSSPCSGPAARIRLTVSSGFYVRSFAHDLGRAVGSLGMMASLVRERQGQFSCVAVDSADAEIVEGDKKADEADETMQTLTYAELAGGEGVWGPRVTEMLGWWNARHPTSTDLDRESGNGRRGGGRGGGVSGRDTSYCSDGRWDTGSRQDKKDIHYRNHGTGPPGRDDRGDKRRRRNSSSPE